MPRNVPELSFSDDALQLRQLVYGDWCTYGTGPALHAVHGATGLSVPQPQDVALESVATYGRHVIPRFDTDPVHSTTRMREAARRR